MALATERQRIQHLLRRAGFGYSPEELHEYVALGLPGTIDRLLNPERVDDAAAEAAAGAFREKAIQDRQALLSTWHARLVLTKRPLQEKLTYFWHDHWATGIRKVNAPSYMLVQNEAIRAGALGKFRDLAMAMTRDPAMMIWLDNRDNVAKAPNENFAREFLELFTLGEGRLYTEKDVKEAARALTGWRVTFWPCCNEQADWDATRRPGGAATGVTPCTARNSETSRVSDAMRWPRAAQAGSPASTKP